MVQQEKNRKLLYELTQSPSSVSFLVQRRCFIGTYKRLPRGRQRPHDEFRDWTLHALIWVKENWKVAIELFAIAAVAFAVMMGARAYWNHRSLAAAEGLYAALQQGLNPDEQAAGLEKIALGYPRTPAGWEAMMRLGDIYLERKDYTKAALQFRTLAKRSRNHAILNIAAIHKLAAVELAGGDPKAAAEGYLKAAADPHNVLSATSRLRAAASLEKAGEFGRAAEFYKQVIDESKEEDRTLKDLSEERLIWLSANHLIKE